MAPKKKKKTLDFLAESILGEISESKKFVEQVNLFRSGLNLKRIVECARLYSSSDEVYFDSNSLLTQLFGSDVVTWTKFAMQHVPPAYNTYKNMRNQCVASIVKQMSSKDLAVETVEDIADYLEEFVNEEIPIGQCKEWEEALLKLTKEEKWNFLKFIAPPVTECLSCESSLSAANPPSLCTVYTLDGPKPSTKITLKCQGYKIFYGCCMYTSNGVSSYYPAHTTLLRHYAYYERILIRRFVFWPILYTLLRLLLYYVVLENIRVYCNKEVRFWRILYRFNTTLTTLLRISWYRNIGTTRSTSVLLRH